LFTAELLDGRGHHLLHLRRVRDVHLVEDHLRPGVGGDGLGGGPALLLVEVGDDDMGAGLGEQAGGGLTHAHGGSGDDGGLTLENGVRS